jgi:serine/threonine-protein kinase
VPFSGDNFVAIAMQHINAPPPPVSLKRPEVPRLVEAAIDKALEKDPANRFPTMAAFCAELEACLADVRGDAAEGATGVLPVVKPRRAPKPVRPRRRWWIAAPRRGARDRCGGGRHLLVHDTSSTPGTAGLERTPSSR